ncbi:MAG TPA: GNAT family N-acetyltransferase [Dehalococcoidia bacterium]|nr:GNAT family N-acetyltransferase [Dehalococcoidia bacterium]
MTRVSEAIRPLDGEENRALIRRLSDEGRLWGAADALRTAFLAATDDGVLAGFVALEQGTAATLLRSLYVEPARRGRGLGRRLVETVEAEASRRGTRRVCLFSTEAGGYFLRLGYSAVPVAEVVEAAAATPQVEWIVQRPEVLAAEVAFAKELV